MKVNVPKDKLNNLTYSELKALYDLKNDKSIMMKSVDKDSVVLGCIECFIWSKKW